jgi:hypothetical protein
LLKEAFTDIEVLSQSKVLWQGVSPSLLRLPHP